MELLFTGVWYFVGQLFGGSSRKLEKLFIAALKLRFHFFPEVSKSAARLFFFFSLLLLLDSFLIVELSLRLKNKQTPKIFDFNNNTMFFFCFSCCYSFVALLYYYFVVNVVATIRITIARIISKSDNTHHI